MASARKAYNPSDVIRTLKLSRATVNNHLRSLDAPKDEAGYYVWSKTQYDKIIKAIRNVRSSTKT